MVDLNPWLSKQPRWLQDAACLLHEQGQISDQDHVALVDLCKLEAEGDPGAGGLCRENRPRTLAEGTAARCRLLRLSSIENVVGINALAPGNVLDLGGQPLSVVYGGNGAGKSGYMRILKHVCDARARGELLPNVFAQTAEARRCTISFTLDGEPTRVDWSPGDGPVEDLRAVAIFDRASEQVYINEEHEAVYEPPQLALLRQLVHACDRVRLTLNAERQAMPSRLPKMPPEYASTDAHLWLTSLAATVSQEDLGAHSVWSKGDQDRLENLNRRLAEVDPKQRAAILRGRVEELEVLKRQVAEAYEGLSGPVFGQMETARQEALQRRRAAAEQAEKASSRLSLGGVGSESWREFWEAARRYSEASAYPESPFPVVEEPSHCVLCQQELDESAATRLGEFAAIAEGKLERDAALAEQVVEELVARMPTVPEPDEVGAILDRAGIGDDAERGLVVRHLDELRRRREALATQTQGQLSLDEGAVSAVLDLMNGCLEVGEDLLRTAELDAQGVDHDRLQAERRELAARRWLSDQRVAVCDEVERLKVLATLERAKKLATTTGLSRQATKLSRELVTRAIESRFRSELDRLGANHLKVEIKRTSTQKGRVRHRLVLKTGTSHGAGAILSDGENRVASLAACFADFLAEDRDVPFVFDDPMSSLDQEHEDRVAERLVHLAEDRQVIVFTHRLPFVIALLEAAKVHEIPAGVSSLERTALGAGVPADLPLKAQPVKKALNKLAGEDLAAVRKAEREQSGSDLRSRTAALCRDIRISLENIVEKELLADVVGRFRRPVTTQGKLHKVARVQPADCELIEEMMTKYSRYVHAQPGESPVTLPGSDELEGDLARLRVWLAEFSAR